MENRYACSPEHVAGMDTPELRERFLVQGLFQPGEVRLVHSHSDRMVIGGVLVEGSSVELPNPADLRAEFFLERRELGVVCIAGDGVVSVDGTNHALPRGACLYVGRGARRVVFSSDAAARFYLVSAPAHATHPTAVVLEGEGDIRELGDPLTSNRRTLNRYIHDDGIASCQLVMGVTRLHPGSTWNTMPSHTHDRRTEAYLYFDLAPDARVVHLMGEPTRTRHLIVANEEAILSPTWSIHSGVGTANYAFVWAMAGENKAFDDMDACPATELL